MDKLKFRMFTWPENPEEYKITAACTPIFAPGTAGNYVYEGLSPLSRVISGRGVFTGEYAVQHFNALAVIMATRVKGELVHPIWGTSQAYLTDLTMEQESRPDYIIYTFRFREADEQGAIPFLPEIDAEQ